MERSLDYARDDNGSEGTLEKKKKVLTFNKLYHDKERNRKIHRSAHRIDCIGDTDGTGGYLVHGHVVIKTADNKENGSRNEVTSVFLIFTQRESSPFVFAQAPRF